MAENTYVALLKETVATTTSSVTFDVSAITGYTDLVIVMNMQGVSASGTGANTAYITFNADTTSGLYSRTLLAGQTTVTSSRETSQNRISLGNQYESSTLSTIFGQMILNIQNYRNTNVFKNVLSHYGSHADRVGLNIGIWRNTNAITSVTISSDSTNGIAVGSSFSLYGIKSVVQAVAPKATGGTIYSDSTYYYHAFGATGTFTPLQSLTCDYVVVAGGGGSGYGTGGGGGAGGFRSFTSQTLSATNYAVTVGAGGAGSTSANSAGSDGSTSSFNSISTTGGGGGGSQPGSGAGSNGRAGGSGGGAARSGTAYYGGSGNAGGYTPVEGFGGGNNTTAASNGCGGGGGAGGAGVSGTTTADGAGGIGATSALVTAIVSATGVGQLVSGTGYIAGGGGGGGAASGTKSGAAGGLGGGANGGAESSVGNNGIENTGGGAGGAGLGNGGRGGSGVVIIRYAKA